MNLVRRVGVRRLASAVAATALGTVAATALATSASAGQHIDAIDDVSITQTTAVTVGSYLRIDATWSIADGEAHAGDTFTLAMPTDPLFEAHVASFDLLNPDGTPVGACLASATAITCTFNDFVEQHTGVHGTLYAWATAKQESTKGTATFTADGRAIETPIPGGGVGPDGTRQVWPTSPFKAGKIESGLAEWSVLMPGATLLRAPGDVTITDTYDARLGAVANTPRVYWVTQEQWTGATPWSYDQFLAASDVTTTLDPATHSLTVAINRSALQADRLYILQYKNTLPADVADGDVFANHAAGTNWQTDGSVQMYGAGGDANGVPLPAPSPTPTDTCTGPTTPPDTSECPTEPAATSPTTSVSATPTTPALDAAGTPSASASTTAPAGNGSVLARTGAAVLGAAGVALALLLGGTTVLVLRRRRA